MTQDTLFGATPTPCIHAQAEAPLPRMTLYADPDDESGDERDTFGRDY